MNVCSIFSQHFSNRTVSLSLLEFKQILLIMCNTQNFEQLTAEEFNLAADHNRCVNRFRFESLIKVISKVFVYLEESSFFRSQPLGEIIQECFQQVKFTIKYISVRPLDFYIFQFFLQKMHNFLFFHPIFPVSWNNWAEWATVRQSLASAKYQFFELFECFVFNLSHQRVSEYCPRHGLCEL